MFTMPQIKEWFNEYNQKYFNAFLQGVVIKLFRGQKYSKILGRWNTKVYIKINVNHNRFQDAFHGENRLKETLIHEMIHAYLFYKHGRGMSGHNALFKMHLKRILKTEFPHFVFSGRSTECQNVDLKIHTINIKPYVPNLSSIGITKDLSIPNINLTKEVPVTEIGIPNLFRVKSTGKIGAKIGESNTIYGKRISLRVIGCDLPFTTGLDNVEPV